MICEFALEFVDYLIKKGYDISFPKTCRFLSMICRCDIENKDHIVIAAKTCLCTSKNQIDDVKKCLDEYVAYKTGTGIRRTCYSLAESKNQHAQNITQEITAIKKLETEEIENIVFSHFNDPLLSIDEVQWLKDNQDFIRSIYDISPFAQATLTQASFEDWSGMAAPYRSIEQYNLAILKLSADNSDARCQKAEEILRNIVSNDEIIREKIKKDINIVKSQYRRQSQELENKKKQIFEENDRLISEMKQMKNSAQIAGAIIEKEGSKIHRSEFIGGKNAILCDSEGEILPYLQRNFSKLSRNEKESIRNYIKSNIVSFRTRVKRNIKVNKGKKIDIKGTITLACRTDGVPMHIAMQKPIRDKTNIILVLDVSGSCRDAAEIMLTFMYYIKEAFPQGCVTLAFTNRLYDISDAMNEYDICKVIEIVMNRIPRSGAYSNYYKPLESIYNNYMSSIKSDSIVIFMGDARNNNNDSGIDFVKAISRKAKKTYWFNTESRLKWDTNDSVAGIYSKYMKMFQVTNTIELLMAIQQI